jgi:hypothetical protein
MHRKTYNIRPLVIMALTLALAIVLPMFLMPDSVLARRGGTDDNRDRFYGIVQSRPDGGLQGVWVIGGRKITTGPGTEFDQLEGPLVVGACAKVDIRNGRVHEIDSEPLRDCK